MAAMNETPLQRTLRIGRVTVGLVGLDVALNRVLADKKLSDDQAAARVFEEIAARNYVPATAAADYREAIAKEIRRLRHGAATVADDLVIRILGPGCVSCNNLQKLVIEVMAEMGVAADVFQVHDLDEIGRFGVMRTPALLINGEVKSAGIHPSRAQIEEWLREAIEINR